MNDENGRSYLTFRAAGELYGCDTALVAEIIGRQAITRVPTAPPFIAGVVNLRGSAIAVIDLAARFGFPAHDALPTTCIIVVALRIEGEDTTLGLLVESVDDILNVAENEILPPPPFGTRIDLPFLRGLAPVADSFATILDLPKILSVNELANVASAAGGGE